MTGAGNVHIRCPVAGFVHLAHLSRRRDGVARLDEERRRPHRTPTAPSSHGCPTPRRSRSSARAARAAATPSRSGRTPRGSTDPPPAPNSSKTCSRRGELDRKCVQPRLPRARRAAPEVRRHVLDHQGRHQLGPRRGQTPRVQAAHRMPDQRGRFTEARDGVVEVGHEPLGADRMGVGDVAPAMPRSVVGVHPARSRSATTADATTCCHAPSGRERGRSAHLDHRERFSSSAPTPTSCPGNDPVTEAR